MGDTVFDFSQFPSYADLVSQALKTRAAQDHWYEYLRRRQARDNEERRLIRETRKLHPGLADYEILARFAKYLDREFPIPQFISQTRTI